MEKIDIVLWIMGGGFSVGFALMWAMWSSLNKRMDDNFDKIDARFDKVDDRFDKLEEKVTDIDRRLCRIEGALSSKECCVLKEGWTRKAE